MDLYRVEVHGLRGYGIDYGICCGMTSDYLIVSKEMLGDAVMYALKNFSTQWEDSILSIKLCNTVNL